MDQIANMLSTIKNAAMAGKQSIELDHSKLKEEVAKVLKDGGFLQEVKVFKEKDSIIKKMRIDIAFDEASSSKVTALQRISKPGRRVYVGYQDIKPVAAHMGFLVLSTSRGVMNSKEARKKKLGGEIICKVY
jgi:small subunit ribosomal protein S8